MAHGILRAALGAMLLSAPAAAQATAPFPFDVTLREGPYGSWEYAPRSIELAELAGLPGLDELTLTGVALPDGRTIELELTRIDFDFAKVGVEVDRKPAPWDPHDLTLWRGEVAGSFGSDVLIGLASRGTYGWIHHEGVRWNVSAFEPEGGSWERAGMRIWAEGVLPEPLDPMQKRLCFADRIQKGLDALGAPPGTQGPVAPGSGGTSLNGRSGGTSPTGVTSVGVPTGTAALGGTTLECKVAVETDFQYYQNFGNLLGAQNFLLQLLAAVSDRYETEIDVVVTYPYVQFYTANNDPWTQNVPGTHDIGDLLGEFRNYYQFNLPGGAHLAHIMSGSGLGGGVAWVDVLCNSNYGFAASGGINGGVNFPITQGSSNWDFIVVAHEMGHQFGTGHTHNYCPPLDNCAQLNPQNNPCQTFQQCSSMGTIMSYCHTCPGGSSNITTYFHPTVRTVIRDKAENSCIPAYNGGTNCPGDSFEPNDSCAAAAVLPGGFVGGLEASEGNVDYFAFAVPANMILDLEVQFSHANGDIDVRLWDAGCTTMLASGTSVTDDEVLSYSNASASTVDVVLEVYNVAQAGCLGYSIQSAVANDPCLTTPDDGYEPNDDCFNAVPIASGLQLGLFASTASPDFYRFDVPAGADLVLDAYFSHSSGDLDMALFDASCGASALVRAESQTNDESIVWTNVAATPRTLIAEVYVASTSSIPCNGYVFSWSITGGNGVGTNYCGPAVTNSTGQPGIIAGTGSASVAAGDLTLTGAELPLFANGYFLVAPNQGLVPNPGGSTGNLCLFPPFGRFIAQTQNSGLSGTMSITVDLAALPQPTGSVMAQAGETWYFQLWFRDSFLGVATSNLTDGLAVTFTQ